MQREVYITAYLSTNLRPKPFSYEILPMVFVNLVAKKHNTFRRAQSYQYDNFSFGMPKALVKPGITVNDSLLPKYFELLCAWSNRKNYQRLSLRN